MLAAVTLQTGVRQQLTSEQVLPNASCPPLPNWKLGPEQATIQLDWQGMQSSVGP